VEFHDGTTRQFRLVGRPQLDAHGEVVQLVGTTIDITQQHLARINLQKAFDEIKELKDQLYR
jgi:hypothetical protein